jgi:AAHS family 4-hydroxybenzoate transporter-like MFS transporter
MNAEIPAETVLTPTSDPTARTRVRVVVLCALVAFLDGFDTQSIGPAGSAIAAQIGLPLSALGRVFSASQVGFLLGALIFSALGDRVGRKRILVVATAVFALCTVATAHVHSYGALLACRLLTGFGLGGATPNFISLACEFARPCHRSRVVTAIWAAVPLGGMTGSFASAAIIPRFGWQAIFIIGCAAPMMLIPVLMATLPESSEIGRRGFTAPPDRARFKQSPVTELFTHQRAPATLLLWGACFMTWMTLIVVAFWTPPLMQHAGMSAAASASILAFNNGGGAIGTLAVGGVLERRRTHGVLIGVFCAAAIFVASMGLFIGHFLELAANAILAGFFSSAAAGALIAVAADAYPPEVRSTGVGWAVGLGRIGSMIGPLLAGSLLANGAAVSLIYLAMAVPAVIAAALIALLTKARGFSRLAAP